MPTTWQDGIDLKKFPKTKFPLEGEVVIVGGGLAGVLSAYLISELGKNVTVVEAERLTSGATSLTTAFLTQYIDTDAEDLEKAHGKIDARKVYESHRKAIDLIEKISKEEKIDCEFTRCSNWVCAASEKDVKDLSEEEKVLNDLGVSAVLKKDKLEIPKQAKFHPLKFFAGLIKACEENGVKFYENSPVKTLDDLKADWIITTTYFPFGEPKDLFLKKGMYVSYIMELKIPKDVLKEGTYESTENPYHYYRVDKIGAHDRMVIGGEDHRKDIKISPEKNFKALEDYIKETFPNLKYEVVRKWRGPILEPSDGLPLIGVYKNTLLASAFSGNGMTYSGVAAQMFSDIIAGKKNPYQKIYSPERNLKTKALAIKARDYTGELIGGAAKNVFKKKNRL